MCVGGWSVPLNDSCTCLGEYILPKYTERDVDCAEYASWSAAKGRAEAAAAAAVEGPRL